jgi:hypothetical protein
MDERLSSVLRTGDKVRTLKAKDVRLGTLPPGSIMPAGSEGFVIEDLNEVAARENRQDPKTWLPQQLRDLTLVKFGDQGQAWFRYEDVQKID